MKPLYGLFDSVIEQLTSVIPRRCFVLGWCNSAATLRKKVKDRKGQSENLDHRLFSRIVPKAVQCM